MIQGGSGPVVMNGPLSGSASGVVPHKGRSTNVGGAGPTTRHLGWSSQSWAVGEAVRPKAIRCAPGDGERVGGILLMILLDAALHLVYESSYRCQYAHRHLARLGSPRSWSPHGADRAALSSAAGGRRNRMSLPKLEARSALASATRMTRSTSCRK